MAEINSHLSDRRITLASPEMVRAYVEDLQNLLANSSLAERKTFIRSFVKEIKVTGDQVVLTYRLPLSSKGLSEEEKGVAYGKLWWAVGDSNL